MGYLHHPSHVQVGELGEGHEGSVDVAADADAAAAVVVDVAAAADAAAVVSVKTGSLWKESLASLHCHH